MEGTEMTTFATDPQISLIRKLLKQAESAASIGNQAEADAYNERATALIAKYGVDQALLAEQGEIEDPIINKLFLLTGDYVNDRRTLFNQIVRALKCQVVFIRVRRPGTAQSYDFIAHVFAHESDMNRIDFLFELLAPQMLVGAAATQAPSWENVRSFRKSWMSGFTYAIFQRLDRTAKEAAAEAGPGTDLVLFDRSKAVEHEYHLVHNPKSLVQQGARRLQGSGGAQGYAAGRRANIGNSVGGSRVALSAV